MTLYVLPRDSLNYIADAFEEQGTWDEDSAFSALCAGLGREGSGGGGISGGSIDEILTEKPTIGPALWLMRHNNHGHFTFPPDRGLIVAADEDGGGIIFAPITDDFLTWVQRRARLEETGPMVH